MSVLQAIASYFWDKPHTLVEFKECTMYGCEPQWIASINAWDTWTDPTFNADETMTAIAMLVIAGVIKRIEIDCRMCQTFNTQEGYKAFVDTLVPDCVCDFLMDNLQAHNMVLIM